MLSLAAFAALDWIVLAGYFALLAVTGVWLNRRPQQSDEEYFLARNTIPPWAAAASLVATSLSAATFLGVPELGYKGDLTYLSYYIAALIAIAIVAAVFVPAYYRHNVTTVYGLLEHRLGPGAKSGASAMFLIGRVFAEGARLYMASIPMAMIVFSVHEPTIAQMLIAVSLLVVIGIFYTFAGGIRSVIFTDVVQLLIFVGAAAVALLVLLQRVPMDWGQIVDLLSHPPTGAGSKLRVIDPGLSSAAPLGVNWSSEFTLLTALSGWVLLSLASYATDHDMAQRILTCRSAAQGSRSAWAAVLMTIPIVLLFLCVGLMLYVYYRASAGGEARIAPPEGRAVFVSFILTELPAGLKGLLIAGLFAAAVSTVNSALNAMSAVFVSEFYRRLVPRRDPAHYLLMGRLSVLGAGLIIGAFAVASVVAMHGQSGGLISFALGVMTYAYSGLVAVFLAALLTRRGNDVSALAALATGFTVIGLLQFQPWSERPFNLAAPWQMVIATTAAFFVCISGRRDPRRLHARSSGG